MNQLIVAEKPSVAQAIARVLGANEKKNGYIEGNGNVVTWCIGHLVELAPPEMYGQNLAKWTREDLPIRPHPYKFVPVQRTREQFENLKRLMNSFETEIVVCATDAGREGELIFRLVYNECGCVKPVKRLWISSMEESAIREGFCNLRDGAEFDALYRAALCRAKADWLIGINMTRLLSTMYGQRLNVGRVMSPTLAMVAEREKAIRSFVPEPFYTVELSCGMEAKTARMNDKAMAQQIAASCQGQTATVTHIERREKVKNPPKLYDLTTLQRDANRLFGFSAQQTLDYAQSLYEKKLLTYPRTDSRFLTSDMEAKLPELVVKVGAALPFMQGFSLPVNASQVVCDAKVSDHHALIPTPTMPGSDLSALPDGEKTVLMLVAVRLICAVGEPYRYQETEVTLDCAGHTFVAKGTSVVQMGWRIAETVFRGSMGSRIDNDAQEDKEIALPDMFEGKTLSPVAASVREGQTSPPKRFTEDTLLAAMESASMEDMPEDAERKGIGTPATRAGIIEKLVKVGFMERKGSGKAKQLVPTQKGENLVAVLPETIRSPRMTAEWEQKLGQIERGELRDDAFMEDISSMIGDQVEHAQPVEHSEKLFPSGRKAIGTCPHCGALVTESPKGFFCENRTCHFRLWKDNRFFTSRGKELDAKTVAALLKDGQAKVKGFVSQRTGKPYEAVVVLELDEAGNPRFRVIFG